MLAHIIRENYAEETAQRKFSPIPPTSPYKCASLAMDRHCLGNILDKVISHLADNHTIRYMDILEAMSTLQVPEWNTLFTLEDEINKAVFMLNQEGWTYLYPYGFVPFNYVNQYGNRCLENSVDIIEGKSPENLHITKYILSRSISFMSELLGHMEYISKLYTLGGIQQACSLFMAFHMQAFACARPETGFGEMDTHDLVTEYFRLESYVIKDFQVLSRMLNEEVTAGVWNIYERVYNVLNYSVPTYGRMLLPAMSMKNLVATKNIILNARKLHGDVVNNQYAGDGPEAAERHCSLIGDAADLERIRFIDNNRTIFLHHRGTKNGTMPGCCVGVELRKAPRLLVPAFIGKDDTGMICLLFPSARKVAALLRNLYGMEAYDPLVSLNTEENVLMNPESLSFPDVVTGFLRERKPGIVSYCGLTDVLTYLKNGREDQSLLLGGTCGDSGCNTGTAGTANTVDPVNLFHKIYLL